MNPRVLYRAATYATDARSTADSVISALTPAAWYRNATGVTSAGGFASQWDDYSGNGRHLVQGTGTNQPAYAAGVFTADGADNYMKITADALLIQPLTVYWVGKQATWTLNDFIFDGNASNSMMLFQSATTPGITVRTGASAITQNDNLVVNTRGVVACVYNGASSSSRVNNTAKATGNAGSGNAGGFTLFCAGGTGGWSNATAEELVIFLAAHDDSTQSSVITALNNALTVF